MNKSKYITCTLPYSNGSAHLGHAFEFIIGDALSRYFKNNGFDTFFNLGLDEHGLKIQQSAEKLNITPIEYVDNLFHEWLDFSSKFQINTFDSFYRTSDNIHAELVNRFWNNAVENGDIYKKKYTGLYCIGCESFKTDRDLIDNKCQDHPATEIEKVEEENYFFKLSKYRKELREWLGNNNDFLLPKSKIPELENIIENIEDISVSRIKDVVSWGIDVPGDDSQTIYVWIDALTNYVFSAGYLRDDKTFNERWNNSDVIQICGPDNLKFQGVIHQGLLASAGIKKSDKLLVHGTILDSQGRKMSKTLGNVINPIDQLEKYGVEAVRYYCLAGLSIYGNSSWDESRLVDLYNSHLADDFGNLISRVTHLADKILEEHIDDSDVALDYGLIENDEFLNFINDEVSEVNRLWESFEIGEALNKTNSIVKYLNKKINDEKPWSDTKKGWTTILEISYALLYVNKLYRPVIPGKYDIIKKALVDCKKVIVFPKIEVKI